MSRPEYRSISFVHHRAIAIAIAIMSLYEYYNIVDGAAAFTKTNKKKWQQTVTWNETYNAPTNAYSRYIVTNCNSVMSKLIFAITN